MKVFISWSGDKSEKSAEELRKWIKTVIQAVEPWMSKVDIDAGERWNHALSTELNDTSFGIICLTKENCKEPWINFEAGALAKTVDKAFVCPYLIDLESSSDIPPGPLSPFQAKLCNKEGTFELISTINKALGKKALDRETLKTVFNKFWPDLNDALEKIKEEKHNPEPKESRDTKDMVKEILEIVRKLSSKTNGEFSEDFIKMLYTSLYGVLAHGANLKDALYAIPGMSTESKPLTPPSDGSVLSGLADNILHKK